VAIEYTCTCGAVYRFSDGRAGTTVRCRICEAETALPGPADGAAAPVGTDVDVPASQKRWQRRDHAAAVEARHPRRDDGDILDGFGEILNPDALSGRPVAVPGRQVRIARAAEPGRAPDEMLVADAASRIATPQRAVTTSNAGPTGSWWLVRGVLLGICAGFLFLPWLSLSAPPSAAGGGFDTSASGYDILRATLEGLSRICISHPNGSGGPGAGALPPGFAPPAAGAVMMAAAPVVYVAGFVLAIPAALVARRYGGRGAVWPFLLCAAGMLTFVAGWLILSHTEAVSHLPAVMERDGAHMGVSGWLCAMLAAMVPISLLARRKP